MDYLKRYKKPTDDPLTQWLEKQDLYRKHVAKDSSCLFRIFAEEVFLTQRFYEYVEEECLHFMEENQSRFLQMMSDSMEHHLENIRNKRKFPGIPEINALSLLYKYDIFIYEKVGQHPYQATCYGFKKTVYLCSCGSDLYDVVYPMKTIQDTATCQSFVYGILYGRVFQQRDIEFAVEMMLYDKNYHPYRQLGFQGDKNLQQIQKHCIPTIDPIIIKRLLRRREQGFANVKQLLSYGLTPFPYKVAKALDPSVYRNIAYDVWSEMRKDLLMGWCSDQNEFQIGSRCLVKLESNKTSLAYIQKMEPNKGPVLVYVTDIAKKIEVPYKELEHIPKDIDVSYLGTNSIRKCGLLERGSILKKRKKTPNLEKLDINIIQPDFFPQNQQQFKSKNSNAQLQQTSEYNNRFTKQDIENNESDTMFNGYSIPNFTWKGAQYQITTAATTSAGFNTQPNNSPQMVSHQFKGFQNVTPTPAPFSPTIRVPTSVPPIPSQSVPVSSSSDNMAYNQFSRIISEPPSPVCVPESISMLRSGETSWTSTDNLDMSSQQCYYFGVSHDDHHFHCPSKNFFQVGMINFPLPGALVTKSAIDEHLPDSTILLQDEESIAEEDIFVTGVKNNTSVASAEDNVSTTSACSIAHISANFGSRRESSESYFQNSSQQNPQSFFSPFVCNQPLPWYYSLPGHQSPVPQISYPYLSSQLFDSVTTYYSQNNSHSDFQTPPENISPSIQDSQIFFPDSSTLCSLPSSPVPLSPLPISPISSSPLSIMPTPSQSVFCFNGKLYPAVLSQPSYPMLSMTIPLNTETEQSNFNTGGNILNHVQ